MRNSGRLQQSLPSARVRRLLYLSSCVTMMWVCPVAATDCTLIPNSTLNTQDQVTNFQQLYGPCNTVAGSLTIKFPAIIDLTGLAGLQIVSGSLLLYNTTNLPSLAGLEGLTQVGDLSIEGATLLTDLAGLKSLVSIGDLHIVRNANLPDLNGLPQTLPSVFNLSVFGNPRMTSLEGMPAFGEISHSLRIGENDILADIAALGSSSFPVGDSPQVDISVNSNPLLTSLSGLPATDKVQTLSITDNCALSSLGGLESLVEVWSGLVIFDNIALSDCSALKVVLDDVDDGTAGPSFGPEDPPDSPGLAFIWIEKNLVGCNSMGQILATAPAEIIFANGLEGCVVY